MGTLVVQILATETLLVVFVGLGALLYVGRLVGVAPLFFSGITLRSPTNVVARSPWPAPAPR